MVARMNHSYKNHSGFLRIAAQIQKRVPNAEFVLVGDGPLRMESEREAANAWPRRPAFFWAIGGHSSRSCFRRPRGQLSDSESLSNVILEAMAARLPVVAYNVGGNSELLNDQRGALIPAGNEPEFARPSAAFCPTRSSANEWAEMPVAFAEENFTLDHVCRHYEDLYMNLLDRKGRRPPTA